MSVYLGDFGQKLALPEESAVLYVAIIIYQKGQKRGDQIGLG